MEESEPVVIVNMVYPTGYEPNRKYKYCCDELFYNHDYPIYCEMCGTIFAYDYEEHRDIGLWKDYESFCPLCDCDSKLYHIMLKSIGENFIEMHEGHLDKEKLDENE